MDKSFFLDQLISIIDEQGLEIQDVCNMLEIDYRELLERFSDKALDHKEAFGIFDDIMDDGEYEEEADDDLQT